MLRPATTIAEKMIKVDHAGENGAVNIYRAQLVASAVRARSLTPLLRQNRQHEEEHRRIFQAYLRENGIRRCISYHACGIGGYALGMVTGLIGPSAVAATTYAVEHVVLGHLTEQMNYLVTCDIAAHGCVASIAEDEQAHHDEAENRLQRDKYLTRFLIAIVKFSTEQVIRFGMR